MSAIVIVFFHRRGCLLLHNLVSAIIQVANLVNYNRHPSRERQQVYCILAILGLWGIVNNAGMKGILDIELAPIELMKKLAEVNFYGMVRVTKAFIPMLRLTKGT